MLIFVMGKDDLDMVSCTEEDLENIEARVRFLEETNPQELKKTQTTKHS